MPKKVTDQGVIGKMFSTGLDLLAIAEEGVRKPSKLPRDVAAHLTKFLDKQKDEIMAIVREEIRYSLKTLPLEKILRSVITEHDVHLTLHMTKRKSKAKKKGASATRRKGS